MSRRCDLTGKGVMVGNNVSHSNRRTRRRFLPNLQQVTLPSELLGKGISLRLAASTIRSIEHNGGLDSYLLSTSSNKLTIEATKLKKQMKKAQAEKAAA